MHQKIKTDKKNIVILGSGFCGLQVAKNLAKYLKKDQSYQIILIDRRNIQVYCADLYEISSAYNKRISKACLTALKDTVSVSIKKAVHGLNVIFIRDEVKKIDPDGRKIILKNSGELPYEYLVLALGCVTNYYNIPGLAEHSYSLKTIEDALALNCHIDQFFQDRYEKKTHQKVHIVVGGGGFTGVEYVCELTGCIKKLSQKYSFDPGEVQITIVQADKEFVGLGAKVSDLTVERFKKLGIKSITNTQIKSYDGKTVTIQSQTVQNIPADILIWTGGVKPNPLLGDFSILHQSKAIEVQPTLESKHYPKVYAGGDNAAIIDSAGQKLLPKLAQLAIQQGKLIGYNICADIDGKTLKIYKPVFKGFVIPLGGTYAIYSRNNIVFSGLIPYLLRRFIDLIYFAGLMSPPAAIKKWIHTENIFLQND